MRRLVLVVCPLVALAGCGNARTPVPVVTGTAAPSAFRALGYPQAGVSLSAPANWAVESKSAPLVATISSGPAVVALWRYPRGTQFPAGAAALRAAMNRLIAVAKARDATLQLIRARTETVDGLPAAEIDAFEQVGGQPRRVRSTHIFVPGAELVLDEYAPAAIFHAVDHAVFSPVKRSLRLSVA
jgi:hypothetical protein